MAAWSRYSVGTPSPDHRWTADCAPFASVGHVAHLDVAVNIIREHKLKPGLVFDKSILKTSRTLVTWLSPNHWSDGYRYGSVKFDFNFRKLVEGKRVYWVEVINYKPVACRILITDRDYDESETLTPYDPEHDDGPWRFDSKTNKDFFNNNICLEFMFEDEIDLDELSNITFVDHHARICSLYRKTPTRCKELRGHGGVAGALLLAKIVAAGLDVSKVAHLWLDDDGTLDSGFAYSLNLLGSLLTRNVEYAPEFSREAHEANAADALARAALNALAIDKTAERKALVSKFKSSSQFMRVVARLVEQSLEAGKRDQIRRALRGEWDGTLGTS